MTEPRSDAEIDADLTRKAELRVAFLRRLDQVKAGERVGLTDHASAAEENQLNIRLANDVAPLRARIAELEQRLSPRDTLDMS